MMTRRAIAAILFIAAAVLTHLVLRASFYHAIQPQSWTFTTERQFHDRAAPVDLLILGDSHAKSGVDPRLLDGAFNFATLGGLYIHNYYLLRHLIEDEGLKPRAVLLPMDTHSLAWQRGRIEERYYWARHFNYAELIRTTGRAGYYARQWLDAGVFPYAGQGDLMVEWFLGRNERGLPYPMVDGFVMLPSAWQDMSGNERIAQAETRCAFLHDDYRVMNPVMMDYFERCLALCAERDIDIVLVRYPVTHEAHKLITANVDLEELDAYYEKLAAEYNAATVDLFEAFLDQPDYFADSDHLNPDGAEALTQRLIAAIRKGTTEDTERTEKN